LVVQVRDPFGNAVDGESVTFRMLEGGGTIDLVSGGGVDSTGVSDVSAEVSAEQWTLGQTVGLNRVEAEMPTGTTTTVEFSATGLPGNGASIALAPLVSNVTVSSPTVVTALLQDQFLNPVPDTRVDVLITGTTDGTLETNPADTNPTTATSSTSRFGTTDSLGQITVVYRAPASAGLVDNVDAFSTGVVQGVVPDAVYTSVASGATQRRVV
jgi:hypothetical protein